MRLALAIGLLALGTWTAGLAAQNQDKHPEGTHHHADAAKAKNPIKPTPESIAAGKKLYDTQCSTCHGAAGRGDGRMAASSPDPKPADLTDVTWKHGSTDGEIFTLISDGSKGTSMRGFTSRMKTDDIWNVVNYLRTLGPTAKPSR